MKDTMEYKGYRARITFEPDDKTFHGTVVNIDDTIHFEGQSVDELKQAFQDSVDEYLDFCRERGRTQILGGISAGDKVATEGGYGLPDDCPVEIVSDANAAEGPPADASASETPSPSR